MPPVGFGKEVTFVHCVFSNTNLGQMEVAGITGCVGHTSGWLDTITLWSFWFTLCEIEYKEYIWIYLPLCEDYKFEENIETKVETISLLHLVTK